MGRNATLYLLPLLLAACTQAPPDPAGAASPAQPAGQQPPLDQPEQDVPPATAPTPGPGLARFDGYAGLRFGMEEAEARSAWDGTLEGGPGKECHYLRPGGDAPSQSPMLMFEDGRLVRYDVHAADVAAPGGGRVGMDAAAIGGLYGDRVVAGPHKYTDGQYLRIEDPDGDGVLVFETEPDGLVTEWHVGLSPQADYVEGCS